MLASFGDRFPTLELVRVWTHRTVRGRYRQSLLGALWAVIQPVVTVAVFSVIFVYFVPVDTGEVPYVVFAFAAMLPWTLFSTSIADMTDSLVTNGALIGKIYFPRAVIPIAVALARVFDFAIAALILAGLMALYAMPVALLAVASLPLVVLVQIGLSVGIGLVASALNVFYRDVRHLVLLGLQVWFYATPVIYPATAVPEAARAYYYLNPMAGLVTAYRTVLFEHTVPWSLLAYPTGCALVGVAFGAWFFRTVERQFADVL